MRNVCELATEQGEQRNSAGNARSALGAVPAGTTVVLPASAGKVRKASARVGEGAGSAGGVAGKRRQTPRMNALLFAMAIEEMMEGPTTRAELSEHTGLHWCTVNLFIATLHKRGLIHVAGWENDAVGRATVAAFAFGRKKDAPKPAPKSKAKAMRDWRDRKDRNHALLASAGVSIQPAA